MTYSQLFDLIEELDLSPEGVAKILGVSGMTIRRWGKLPRTEALPKMYERAFEAAVYDMIARGQLSPQKAAVRAILEGSSHLSIKAAMTNLGLSEDMLNEADQHPEALVKGLAQIGSDSARRQEVLESESRITEYGRLGEGWKERLSHLLQVLKSKKITALDKMVAFGAFFYLITPFDLVPDMIPVVGLLDDFAILGIASLYYARRFPEIFKKN